MKGAAIRRKHLALGVPVLVLAVLGVGSAETHVGGWVWGQDRHDVNRVLTKFNNLMVLATTRSVTNEEIATGGADTKAESGPAEVGPTSYTPTTYLRNLTEIYGSSHWIPGSGIASRHIDRMKWDNKAIEVTGNLNVEHPETGNSFAEPLVLRFEKQHGDWRITNVRIQDEPTDLPAGAQGPIQSGPATPENPSGG